MSTRDRSTIKVVNIIVVRRIPTRVLSTFFFFLLCNIKCFSLNSNEIYFSSGAETDDNEFHVDITVTGGSVTSLASTVTATNISIGAADDAPTTGMANLRSDVDTMQLSLGNMYNKIQNISDQFTNHKASYEQDLSSKMDVDFAGETTLLAKNQILAQAGTAMLAQANAQGQGMLALIQS
jgi:flagellin